CRLSRRLWSRRTSRPPRAASGKAAGRLWRVWHRATPPPPRALLAPTAGNGRRLEPIRPRRAFGADASRLSLAASTGCRRATRPARLRPIRRSLAQETSRASDCSAQRRFRGNRTARHSVDSVCERGRLPMKLVVVSNRVVEGSARGAIPGGLAAALVAAVAESGGTWVGGSGKLLNPSDELRPTGLSAARTTTLGAGTLLKVDLPAIEYRRFYNGMANGALWPILHYRPDLVRYEPDYF